jgi:hypothetical protein
MTIKKQKSIVEEKKEKDRRKKGVVDLIYQRMVKRKILPERRAKNR